ncbi:hypothetical protein GCM10023075_36770 [Streptosporangium album]
MQVSGPPSRLCPKVLKEALTCISVGFFASTTGTPAGRGVKGWMTGQATVVVASTGRNRVARQVGSKVAVKVMISVAVTIVK